MAALFSRRTGFIGVVVLFYLTLAGILSGLQAEVAPPTIKANDAVKQEPNQIGGQITFSSDRTGSWRIWIMNADSSNIRQLTPGSGEDQDVDPVFSPHGQRVLFSSTRGGAVGIWQLDLADPNQMQRICDGDQAQWSPDSRKIVFRRDEKIFVRSLIDGQEKLLSPADWPHCSGPSWKPSKGSTTIAFACRWEAGNGIFIVDEAGGEPQKVYDKKGACAPQWSPDGKTLVYETETNICTIQPDGTKNRIITYFGGVQRYPGWNPDGKKIIYCQGTTENGPWEIYTIDIKGGKPVKLTQGHSDMNPDWK